MASAALKVAPNGDPIMDVKESVEWGGQWWDFFHGRLPQSKLPSAPQGRKLSTGTLTGSVNYKAHTLVNAVLDPRLYGNESIGELVGYYARQINRGHMDTEELTPSHSFQHYFPHAMLLFFARKQGLYGLSATCLDWWQRELELLRIFGTPLGVVAPGARGAHRGKEGLVGRNPYRDQLYRFVLSGNLDSLPKDKGKHPATLIWSALRDAGFEDALKPPLTKVKLMFPVHRVTEDDGSFTAWLPPEAMSGLSGPQKPQMVAGYNAKTGKDWYGAETFEPLMAALEGRRELIGQEAA